MLRLTKGQFLSRIKTVLDPDYKLFNFSNARMSSQVNKIDIAMFIQ